MASQAPSIQSLQNWEDVFVHYPLPTVRALEKDLRKNIDENRSKLRSLVGASYRDLLGTAERITEMDGQMTALEHGLGDIGRRCDARILEKSGSNWAGMKKWRSGGEANGMAVMAQTKVLQGCLTVVGRVVKGKGDALLGAKVLVLARLLARSIGDSGHAPAVLEELRKRLTALRKKLLVYIERSVTRLGIDKPTLVSTLCAYILESSLAPKEALRYFLQVRFRQLENMADSPGEEEMMEMLDLYSRTLLDTKDLFPRRFADALAQLPKVPLLRGAQAHCSHELSLDIYGQWIPEDIRKYTSWVQHDQATSSEVSNALASWTKQAHECLLTGVEEYLEKQIDLPIVVESRHAVLSKFMALSSRLRNNNHANAINSIRETFLKRIKSLVANSAALPKLSLENGDSRPERKESLWNLARLDTDLSSGAHAFRHSIVHRRHGRDESIDTEIAKLDAWIKRIESSLDSINHTRTRKWDDDLDFDVDDLDDGDILQETLSKADPKEMTQSLSEAVEASVSSSFGSMQAIGDSTQYPAYVLRMWREVDLRILSLQARLDFSPARISLQALHRNLALATSRTTIDDYLQSRSNTSQVATTLWDGTPPLPVQPAPTTFKFLSALHRTMSEVGDDLWSPECILELRKTVDERLREDFCGALPSQDKKVTLTNGHAEGSEEARTTDAVTMKPVDTNAFLQSLFDLLYLQQIFHQSKDETASSGLASVIAELRKRTEIDQASHERMERSAKEYWKRTYLLFGLLANRAKD